jgi:hypothetical protein
LSVFGAIARCMVLVGQALLLFSRRNLVKDLDDDDDDEKEDEEE